MAALTLDKILTYSDWSLHKNILAALANIAEASKLRGVGGAGGTGIGQALKTLESEFKKVSWSTLDAQYLVDYVKTPNTFDGLREKAKTEFKKTAAVVTAAKSVSTTAAKAEAALKTNKAVPEASKKHVTAIKTAADKLATQIGGLLGKPWDDGRKVIVNEFNVGVGAFQNISVKLPAMAAAIEGGNMGIVDTFWTEYKVYLRQVRAVLSVQHGTWIAAEDEALLKFLEERLEPLSEKPKDAKNIPDQVDKIVRAVNEFDNRVA